jgi:hypothetical protein
MNNDDRMKVNREWTKYLKDHPGAVYPHWLKDQLIMRMKKVDSLLLSVEELRKSHHEMSILW